MPQPERKTKMYGSVLMAKASDIYINDQKKMAKDGWHVVSATEIGQGKLNVIYERGGTPSGAQQPTQVLNVQNLQLLFGMLSPEERAAFEQSVQQIVNQWLARKATGQ